MCFWHEDEKVQKNITKLTMAIFGRRIMEWSFFFSFILFYISAIFAKDICYLYNWDK